MKRALLILGCSAVVLLMGVMAVSSVTVDQNDQISVKDHFQAETVEIQFPDGFIETADVADTHMERVQGLSDRQTPQSMLFIFSQKDDQVFWMKGMQFAIDFVWMDDQTIVGITKHALPEDPAVTLYTSPTTVDRVLEVPAGMVQAHQLQVGDKLDMHWKNE